MRPRDGYLTHRPTCLTNVKEESNVERPVRKRDSPQKGPYNGSPKKLGPALRVAYWEKQQRTCEQVPDSARQTIKQGFRLDSS